EEATASALGTPTRRGPRPREAPHLARRIFRERGRTGDVRTTLAQPLQRRASELLERELLGERDRNVHDGAALVVENATGDVLAWVGGSGRGSSARHVDGVLARRQVGSTVKPFLYALALDRRILTAASLLDDTPVEIPVLGGVYRPRNYDREFRGAVSLRTALASSLNVPAVRTQELLGEPALVSRLVALDFAGVVDSGDHYGPSLALGSADVSLLELVNAYRTLANGGVWRPLRLLPDDESYEGRRVFSEAASFVVSDILSDRESRSTTFGLENPLATRFWTAVKTGTSKDMRDNWCIGYSRDYTVGVWVGNFSGEPMHDVSGVTGAAPIWLEIVSLLHAERSSVPPEPPPGVIARYVSFGASGEPARAEWFLEGTEPAGSRIEAAPVRARIVAPTEGGVLALDPDVPPALQRIALLASKGDELLEWRLDGRPLAPAHEPFLWRPEPGRHELALTDASGLVRDRVGFAVRE
ncbi:MAG: penicillin-binding protein 1C, partial [Deltaproteobacteria bacterium]|nr:penicillin-binding protein 1C [Deltaproteobacteria bacterium]